MTKEIVEFFFKPCGKPLTADRILSQAGIDPTGMDEEVLRSYGIYPIQDGMNPSDILENPSPVYKDMGDFFLKSPSTEDINLEGAKSKVIGFQSQKAEVEIKSLMSGFFLPPDLIIGDHPRSSTLQRVAEERNRILRNLDDLILEIEAAESISDLREIMKKS